MHNITKLSPHLAGVLKRIKEKPDLATLDDLFQYAIQNNAAQEPDFDREAGVSFNPRPARILLILINDAESSATNTLAAALLSSIPESSWEPDSLPTLPEPIKILSASARQLSSAKENTFDSSNHETTVIAASIFLDRIRHLHLCMAEDRKGRFLLCLKEAEEFVSQCQISAPRLAVLIQAWRLRFEARRLSLSE